MCIYVCMCTCVYKYVCINEDSKKSTGRRGAKICPLVGVYKSV